MKNELFAAAYTFLTIFGAFVIAIWQEMTIFVLWMTTKRALSILIPTYNDLCVNLVGNLHQQAEAVGIMFEILVGDDGSTDTRVVADNKQIGQWEHCRYLIQPQNAGRAAIRNILAKEAQ